MPNVFLRRRPMHSAFLRRLLMPNVLLWVLSCAAALGAGCIAGDGDFVATLSPAILSAQLPLGPGRRGADNWLLQSGGSSLSLDSLDLSVSDLILRGSSDYAGSPFAPIPLVSFPVMGDVPVATHVLVALLPGVPLGSCDPRCQVDRTVLVGGGFWLRRLRAAGAVRLSGTARAALRFSADVSLVDPAAPDGVPLADMNPVTLSREVPERLQVGAILQVDAGLFDGIDLAALPLNAGQICLGVGNGCISPALPVSAAIIAQLRANLARGTVQIVLSAAPDDPNTTDPGSSGNPP